MIQLPPVYKLKAMYLLMCFIASLKLRICGIHKVLLIYHIVMLNIQGVIMIFYKHIRYQNLYRFRDIRIQY